MMLTVIQVSSSVFTGSDVAGMQYDHVSKSGGSPRCRISAVDADQISRLPSNLRIGCRWLPFTMMSAIAVPAAALRYLAASSASSSPVSVPGKVAAGIPEMTPGSASSTT